jgi:hypothetical protein
MTACDRTWHVLLDGALLGQVRSIQGMHVMPRHLPVTHFSPRSDLASVIGKMDGLHVMGLSVNSFSSTECCCGILSVV